MVKNIITEDFEKEILKSDKPVLVDFWASWCGPCRMIAPVVENISNKLPDKAKFCKVNVDEEPDIANRYEIMSIPTLIVFKDGQIAAKSVGVKTETEISRMLQEFLD